jgi:pyruvate,water dikinase
MLACSTRATNVATEPVERADALRAYVVALDAVSMGDVARVGGKNASLGELLRELGRAGARPESLRRRRPRIGRSSQRTILKGPIREIIGEYSQGRLPLEQAGARLRERILAGELPGDVAADIVGAYRRLGARRKNVSVAVRSSATAEDLPEASFAGQQETFLNVRGEAELLAACRRCFASLFTDRAIAYRDNHGIEHTKVALSVGVQPMVRSDRGAAGVMFSVDTETGFPGVVVISASWGLGETVVQGSVDPDEYRVFKPLLARPDRRPVIEHRVGSKERKLVYGRASAATVMKSTTRRERAALVLSDDEILELARWAA